MLSKIAYIFSSILFLYASLLFYPKWDKPTTEATIAWDVSGYYWYLPATFIYKDLKKQKFAKDIIQKYQPTPNGEQQQSFKYKNGNYVNVYSSGMAVMYLPFFTVAHLAAKPLGYAADGFSIPYQMAIQFGSLLVALMGMWYYRKFLLKFYNDKVTAIMLLLLAIGSNYLNYAAIDNALTHNWLFTLYALLLLNTYHFYHKSTYKYSFRIGILIGFIILIRPTEIIAILIPLLWGIEGISVVAFKNRIAFLKTQLRKISLTAISIILIGSVQIIYWLYVTGEPFVYSYEEKGFSWLHPHFYDYSLSFKSGWLRYTPLLIFSFVGIIPFLKYGTNKVMVLLFFFFSLYITSAWDIWWYGGTGGRAMIQSYPVILLPFATMMERVLKTRITKWVLLPILLLFSYINIWFTYNAHAGQGIFDSASMSKAYYWGVIGRFSIPEEKMKLKDTKNVFLGTPKEMELIYENNFENIDDTLTNSKKVLDGQKSLYIKGNSITPHFAFNYNNDNHKKWIRVEASYECLIKEYEPWRMAQLIVRFTKTGIVVKENVLRIHRYMESGETKDIYLDAIIPTESFDRIIFFYKNDISDREMLVDNLKIYSFND